MEAENLYEAVRAAILRIESEKIRCALWERHWSNDKRIQNAEKYGVSDGLMASWISRGYQLLRKDKVLQKWAAIYGYMM